MNLPEAFKQKMLYILGTEFDDYIKSFEEQRICGLRINTLKITKKEFTEKNIFETSDVPWCDTGFYYNEDIRPAKHPYYYAGLYYLQEPSAMSPGAMLPIEQGDFVLDICAAPGGKSTHIASRLKGTGILVANDISATRARSLLKNIEMAGITNAIVTAEEPKKLGDKLGGFFDKIIIDAPCSGEGMFRKEPSVMKSWGEEMYDFCRKEQKEILERSKKMLKKGGYILFSTCTFAPEENEKTINDFLDDNPQFELVPLPKAFGFADGRPDLVENGREELKYCARLMPHKVKGEGHFLALLHNKEESDTVVVKNKKEINNDKRLNDFYDFIKNNINMEIKGDVEIINDNVYIIPQGMAELKGIRVLRSGWHMGELKKGRFEPSQALIMGLKKEQLKNVIDLNLDDQRVIKYLKGETLEGATCGDGWSGIAVDGFMLGWGKVVNGRVKNKYPVNWKWE